MMIDNFEPYRPLMESMSGSRVLYVQMPGNAGDDLIREATFRLFRHFRIDRIEVSVFDIGRRSLISCASVVFSGGGNTGRLYEAASRQRDAVIRRAVALRRRAISLPQSVYDLYPDHALDNCEFYARDQVSQSRYPRAGLLPDIGGSVRIEGMAASAGPIYDTGIFMRRDAEAAIGILPPCSIEDPAYSCKTCHQYLRLASLYRTIITNRLHFALAAMSLGRKVIVTENSYDKILPVLKTLIDFKSISAGDFVDGTAFTLEDWQPWIQSASSRRS